MRISNITIKNFKGLRNQSFSPKTFSCLVGENNAGKSTVLQALAYALNRPRNIPASMFYDDSQPIVFELKFEDVTQGDLNRLKDEHRTKVSPLVYGGEFTLTSKYTKADGLALLVSKLVPTNEKYRDENINDYFKGLKSPAQAKKIVDSTYPELADDLPDGTSVADTKRYLKEYVRGLDEDQLQYMDTQLPSGIPTSISAFIPEPIYIPAVKNFEDDLKTTQSTSFGRLLGLLTEDLAPDLQDISDTLIDLRKRLNRYVDDNGDIQDERLPKVIELENTIEGYLSENFPNVSLDLEIPPPEIKTILNTAKIYLDDGSRDLIDNKGDGVKRSLTFSLLRAYVDILRRKDDEVEVEDETVIFDKPLIFLFEEPELYLHPKAQRTLFGTLAEISKKYQTVITTHSPLFFEPGVTAQFVRVAKQDADPKPVGKLFPVDFEIDEESLNVFRMAKFDHSEAAFFSNHIVLYEGESDAFFFKHIATMINSEWSFDDKNIALVEVGGKGNFSRFRRFFESFGLKVSILSDLDVIVEGFNHLGASDEARTLRQALLQSVDNHIAQEGITPQLTGKRVKRKVRNPRWVEKYETAKTIVNDIAATGNVSDEQKAALNSLFVWESDEARYTVLATCEETKTELLGLLDSLRGEDIYILSRGAIEEYYPEEVITNFPKPERALRVAQHVTSRDLAISLSEPLLGGRPTEFEQFFQDIFNA